MSQGRETSSKTGPCSIAPWWSLLAHLSSCTEVLIRIFRSEQQGLTSVLTSDLDAPEAFCTMSAQSLNFSSPLESSDKWHGGQSTQQLIPRVPSVGISSPSFPLPPLALHAYVCVRVHMLTCSHKSRDGLGCHSSCSVCPSCFREGLSLTPNSPVRLG